MSTERWQENGKEGSGVAENLGSSADETPIAASDRNSSKNAFSTAESHEQPCAPFVPLASNPLQGFTFGSAPTFSWPLSFYSQQMPSRSLGEGQQHGACLWNYPCEQTPATCPTFTCISEQQQTVPHNAVTYSNCNPGFQVPADQNLLAYSHPVVRLSLLLLRRFTHL